MNKLDVIKFLLQEVEEEQTKLIEYQKIVKEAYEQNDINNWRYIDKHWGDKPVPSKSKILDNLKMIRRLSLEISKEVENIDV